MRVAIVEDEKIHQDYLMNMLEFASESEGISLSLSLFDSAENFLFHLEDKTFDAILLDIVLDEMNGFSLAQKIRATDNRVPIAFITGEKDYVFDGYQVDACGYILKPIKQENITSLLMKLKEKVSEQEVSLTIKTKEGIVSIYQRDIEYIESDNHSTIVYLSDCHFASNYKMKEWEALLHREDFFKSHRCYMVNLHHISRIDKKNILVGDKQLPIARGKWEPLMKAYMNHRRQAF